MIKNTFSIAANRIIIDAGTNSASIIDVFEGMRAQSFPIIIPSLTFMFYLVREDSDPLNKDVSVQCLVDSEEVIRIPATVNFEKGKTNRFIIAFEGFVIPKPGVLKISLLDENGPVGVLELLIEKMDMPQAQVKGVTIPSAGA